MVYRVILSKQALKDLDKLKRAGLGKKAKLLINVVSESPFKIPPCYEKLSGDLRGYYSRRINEQHRFVYEILPNAAQLKDSDEELYEGIIKVISMWTHYHD